MKLLRIRVGGKLEVVLLVVSGLENRILVIWFSLFLLVCVSC